MRPVASKKTPVIWVVDQPGPNYAVPASKKIKEMIHASLTLPETNSKRPWKYAETQKKRIVFQPKPCSRAKMVSLRDCTCSLCLQKNPFHTLHLKVATHYRGSWNSWHQLQQSLLLVVFWGTKLVSNWPTPQICLVPKWSCRSSKAALCERILLEGPYQKPAKPSCETCNKGELREKWGVHIFVGGWLFFFYFLVLVVFFRDVLVDPRQFWDPKPPGRPVLRIHGSTVS